MNIIKKIEKLNLSCDKKIAKLDSLLDLNLHNDSLYYFKNYYAKWLYKNKRQKKAILLGKEVLILSNNKEEKQKSLYYLGMYYKSTNLSFSNNYFFECLDIDNNNRVAINTYYRLGNNFSEIFDFTKANEYYNIVIKKNKNKPNRLLRNSYYKIANNLFFSKDEFSLQKAAFYIKKADSLSKIIPTRKQDSFLINLLQASVYNEESSLDIKKSLHFYLKAIEIALEMNDSVKINNSIIEIGNLFNTTDIKKSLYYLDKVKPKPNDSTLISDLAFNYGLTYNYAKDYKKSIQQYKKAVNYKIGTNFTPLKNNDSILLNIDYKERLLHILPFYALSYYNYYKDTYKREYLTKSLFYYKLSDRLIDLIRINSSEFKSRLFWSEKSEQIYAKAIEVAFQNNNIEDAFYFMEKNKALLLMEDVAKEQYKLTLDIPKNLLAKEVRLKKEIIELKNTNFTKKIVDKERELSIYQDSIYGNDFFDINIAILSTLQLQNKLSNDDIFVEYFFVGDNKQVNSTNNGYVIFITKNNKYFYEIDNLAELKVDLVRLIGTYRNPLKTKEEINTYNNQSFKVYDKLFPSNKIKSLIKNKNMTIATDSYLSYLPFEALITQKDSVHYLIQDCTIRYEYSYSFSQNRKPPTKKSFKNLGVAPFVFKDSSLNILDNSPKELIVLSKIYPTTLFERNNATKGKFINEIANYNIIHLATHANAQDSITPWIAFYDKKLNLPELQLLQNKASLVVLSGCNTTLGKQEIGEGVMSLARGFFYGGAQSVISSLWSIDDVSTTFIMEEFYKNLSKGKTKSESLRNAKLSYLESHSLSEVSPHFWASFILLGSDDTIIPISSTPYYVFLFIFLLLIIIILRYKLKK